MTSKTIYRVCVPTGKFKPKGEDSEKQKWTQVGVGFENDNGSINVKIDQNITVSNEMVLFLPKTEEKQNG